MVFKLNGRHCYILDCLRKPYHLHWGSHVELSVRGLGAHLLNSYMVAGG
jgi:hypothetical protein